MATVKDEVEAKIKALRAEADDLETHLKAGGNWIEQEAHVIVNYVTNIIHRARGLPQVPLDPVPPPPSGIEPTAATTPPPAPPAA